jgi:hypothetical protein
MLAEFVPMLHHRVEGCSAAENRPDFQYFYIAF